MLQKLILGGGNFYSVFVRGIFWQNTTLPCFSKHEKRIFGYRLIFYSIFGSLENNVIQFLHSKAN